MLISQHGGRHQYSHLLTVASSLESSSYGNLRLSEANIATNQTIHRSATLHVFLHLSRSLSLIGGILIKERRFQLMLQITVGTIGKALFSSALRIELYQISGYILNLLLCLFLQSIPGTSTQRRQTRRFTRITPTILAYLIKRMDRDVNLIIIFIDNTYHFLITIASRNTYQSAKLTDTKVHMHDKIPRFHFLQFLHGKRHFSCPSLV